MIRTPSEMRARADAWRRGGSSIGLVPTMGALHDGHLSLVRRARAENSRVVVSIFVNPLQFGPNEDFERYPRTLESDLEVLAREGVDAVYAPAVEEMYAEDSLTRVRVTKLGDVLEGKSRPGFFDGVATVVTKLLNTVRPDRAYFGQKDAQQAAVVTKLARDLDTGVEIRVSPTLREADGVALSSRNRYLSPEERLAARRLSAALEAANDAFIAGERRPEKLRELMSNVIAAEPRARVDYVEVVDPVTFTTPDTDGEALRAVLAVWIGATRLIDNHLLGTPLQTESENISI